MTHATSPSARQLVPGELVVVPREPELGVGRLERIIDVEGRPHGRVIFYEDGRVEIRALDAIAPCPPGVWDRAGPR